jgi:hypothetical protein
MPKELNPATCINFVGDVKMRDELHAVARAEDRSMSAVVRVAVRAYLDGRRDHAARQYKREESPA